MFILSLYISLFRKYCYIYDVGFLLHIILSHIVTLDCHCQNYGQQIDEGDIHDVERLPITGLRLGDVDENDEWIYFTLGPLICQHGK